MRPRVPASLKAPCVCLRGRGPVLTAAGAPAEAAEAQAAKRALGERGPDSLGGLGALGSGAGRGPLHRPPSSARLIESIE